MPAPTKPGVYLTTDPRPYIVIVDKNGTNVWYLLNEPTGLLWKYDAGDSIEIEYKFVPITSALLEVIKND